MKEKVLILASWYPSKTSWVNGIFIQDQAKVLAQVYDIAVFVPRIIGWQDAIKEKVHLKSKAGQYNGIKVYRQETLALPRIFSRFQIHLFVSLAQRRFAKVLANWGRPDIIHAHVVFPGGWIAANLGRKYSIPVVLTEHSGPFSVHMQTKRQRRLVEETLGQIDRIVAVSPALAAQIHNFFPSVHIDIVGNAIMSEFFSPVGSIYKKKLQSKTRFLSIALLNENKGIHHLLEAIHLIIQRANIPFELFIGGEGPARPALEKMTSELGLSDQCHFLGMLVRSKVRYWMQQCDVFILPSLLETFGVVLGEAMACGKPVIATRCGGPEFVITPETGILVDTEDPIALAEAISRFISGQVKFDSNTIRRSIVRRFGEEAFLRNISAIYEKL